MSKAADPGDGFNRRTRQRARGVGVARRQHRRVTESRFWDVLMHDVFGPRQGGAIIFLDAENARKGVAKTSGACAVARLLATAFDYELKTEDFTLSGYHYLKRYQEHPGAEQPSVLVLDEFVGAGAGDKRRHMTDENIKFGRAWQLLRAKRVVTIATLPDWNEADKRLKKMADYRLWCRERPMGVMQPYKIQVPFNSSGSVSVRTKAIGAGDGTRIAFPNMDARGDPFYRHLTKRKDKVTDTDEFDADSLLVESGDESDDELSKRRATGIALRLYEPWNDENDTTYKDIARVVEDYSKSWVGDRVQEWRKGEHRDLVPDPTASKAEA